MTNPTGIRNPSGVTSSAAENLEDTYVKEYEENQHQPAEIRKEEPPSDVDRNFAAIREELAREKREKEELKANFEIWKASLSKQNVPEPQVPQNPFKDLDKEDAVTVGAYQAREEEMYRRQMQLESDMSELRLAVRYPNYREIVDEYAAPLIREKPSLAAGLKAAQDPWAYAYEIGQLAKQSKTAIAPETQVNKQAQRIMDNAKKPGSLSQAGGQGSFSQQSLTDFANMSEEQFEQYYRKFQGGH